jgi:hypothetical protein
VLPSGDKTQPYKPTFLLNICQTGRAFARSTMASKGCLVLFSLIFQTQCQDRQCQELHCTSFFQLPQDLRRRRFSIIISMVFSSTTSAPPPLSPVSSPSSSPSPPLLPPIPDAAFAHLCHVTSSVLADTNVHIKNVKTSTIECWLTVLHQEKSLNQEHNENAVLEISGPPSCQNIALRVLKELGPLYHQQSCTKRKILTTLTITHYKHSARIA